MTKKNEPQFIPKGFITLAEAIQRVGKHRHPDTWTGVESYHHEATDDWEVEHRLRRQQVEEIAVLCTTSLGPDWWMRVPGANAETPAPADALSELIQVLDKEATIDCSEEGIAQLWSTLRDAQENGTLVAINEAEAAVRRAEFERTRGRERVASQIYELAAVEAAGNALPDPWPSGYRTPDGQLPKLDSKRYDEFAEQQAEALAVFQGVKSHGMLSP